MESRNLARNVLAGLVLLLAFAPNAYAQPREYTSLNADESTGIWTFVPLVPSGYSPGPIAVPSWWSDHNPDWDDDWPSGDPRNKHIEQAKYMRLFDIPASMAGRRIKLFFAEVNHAAEVRVNGLLVGPKHYQGTVPFEYDITSFVAAPSTNNLLEVTVWDHNALRNLSDMSKYLYPFGHPMWANKMNGIAQDVILYAVPKIYVKDVFVITSVEASAITLKITIANEDTIAHSVAIENDIRRIDQLKPTEISVLERTLDSSGPITVNPGEEIEVTLSDAWTDPVLWWPHQPQLYRLHTRLLESGSLVDEKTDVRFGFREFKVSDSWYTLNGVPFHGWGDTINGVAMNVWLQRDLWEYVIDTYKAAGCRLIRHGAAAPPPALFYDICDEKGMLCYAEMDYNGQNEGGTWDGVTIYTHDYGNPTFEANVAQMVTDLVKRYRNHPSIVIWSIENEVFYSGPPSYGDPARDRIAVLRTVIDALDGTRPVGCDSDGSLSGALAIKNKHYPGSVSDVNDDGPAHAYTNWSNNNNIYWVTGINPPWVPLGVGEYMFNKTPSPDVNNIQCPTNWGRLKALQLRAYRLAGFSDIRPFTLTQEALALSWFAGGSPFSTRASHILARKSMSPVAAFDHAYDGMGVYEIRGMDVPTYPEGTTVPRTYDIYNDDLEDPGTDISINWEVRLYDKITDARTTVISVPLGGVVQAPLEWVAPLVNQTTRFVVGVEAQKSGKTVFRNYRIFKATDTGGSYVPALGTFRDDFSGSVPTGLREHDTWWRLENGEYAQPETRGLFVSNIPWYNPGTDSRPSPVYPYGFNCKMSAIEPWTFDDFRAVFDVKVTGISGSWQWAGMGFRLTHPEDSPYEHDTTRRSGYYVVLLRNGASDRDAGGQSNWWLAIGQSSPSEGLTTLAQTRIPVPGSQFVRVETRFQGGNITAEANNDPSTQAAIDDATMYSFGYSSLVMSDQAAASYDNIAVGRAPFPPVLQVPPVHASGSDVTVSWGTEEDATEYLIEWSMDGFQTLGGSSGAITGTAHTFSGLLDGVVYFRGFSLDTEGQQSAQSRIVTTVLTSTAPTADFLGSPTSGTASLRVQFTDLSSNGPTAWAWDFQNDGTFDSNLQNPEYTYDFPGTYTVKLVASNPYGSDEEVKVDYVTVLPSIAAPIADFAALPTSGVVPLFVQFTDLSANVPTAWAWDFDNNGTIDSTEQNPSSVYPVPGAYSVRLTVSNAGGADDELKLNYITAYPPPPVADFSASPTIGTAPLPVAFTDMSTNSPSSWAWDFDNNGVVDSTEQNPQHTYSAPGLYTVRLTASNSGGSDSEVKPDYIKVGAPSWSDDVEGSTSGWTRSGLWHLVHGTGSHDLAHSGTHSWYYGQDSTGNYDTGSANASSLSSPSFMVVGGGKLSFWRWEETENYPGYDLRKVFIRSGGQWVLVHAGDYDVSDERMWKLEDIDLTSYEGEMLTQVRFDFDTVDAYYNDYRGWYIDDVSVTARPAPVGRFLDDMEGDSSLWSGATGLWHVVANTGHSGTHSWYYGMDESLDYDTGERTSGSIRTVPIDVGWGFALSFWRWEETENYPGFDLRTVLIGKGATWQAVYLGNYTPQDDGKWVKETIDLSSYAGQKEIRFSFDSVDELYNDYRGWYIDDVSVTAMSAPLSFQDDVESGSGKWSYSSGLWHISSAESHSSNHSWYYGKEGDENYATGERTSGALVTPPIVIGPGARLAFWRWEETENYQGFDSRAVYLGSGSSWALIYLGNYTPDDDGRWLKETIDISAYQGQTLQINFTFDSVDSLYNDYRGYFIDDVTVGGP